MEESSCKVSGRKVESFELTKEDIRRMVLSLT